MCFRSVAKRSVCDSAFLSDVAFEIVIVTVTVIRTVKLHSNGVKMKSTLLQNYTNILLIKLQTELKRISLENGHKSGYFGIEFVCV